VGSDVAKVPVAATVHKNSFRGLIHFSRRTSEPWLEPTF
jgi:hypothetical protein